MKRKRPLVLMFIIALFVILSITVLPRQIDKGITEADKALEEMKQLQQNEPSFQASGDVNWNDTKAEIDAFDSFILTKVSSLTWEARITVAKGFFTDSIQCRDSGTLAQRAECFRSFCDAGTLSNATTTTTKSISTVTFNRTSREITLRFTTPTEISPKDLYNDTSTNISPDMRKAEILYKLICRWLP